MDNRLCIPTVHQMHKVCIWGQQHQTHVDLWSTDDPCLHFGHAEMGWWRTTSASHLSLPSVSTPDVDTHVAHLDLVAETDLPRSIGQTKHALFPASPSLVHTPKFTWVSDKNLCSNVTEQLTSLVSRRPDDKEDRNEPRWLCWQTGHQQMNYSRSMSVFFSTNKNNNRMFWSKSPPTIFFKKWMMLLIFNFPFTLSYLPVRPFFYFVVAHAFLSRAPASRLED